ncbi:MAG: STAS domain-containing protein [Thermoguttaceae bacterium]
MQLSVRSEDGPAVRIDLRGRINMARLAEQQEALSELIQPDSYKRMVLLDMSGVELVDSAGLSWLVVQHKRFCDGGGRLVIHSVPFTILETLKVMRLDQVLHVAPSESKAVALLQGVAP